MRLLNADAAIAAGVIGSREPDSPITVTNSALVGLRKSPYVAEHESASLHSDSRDRVQRRRALSRFEIPFNDVRSEFRPTCSLRATRRRWIYLTVAGCWSSLAGSSRQRNSEVVGMVTACDH